MKKSASIVLGLSITLSACYSDRKAPAPVNTNASSTDWTYGKEAPDTKDTVVNGNHYRRHYGLYYPIIAGMIAPRLYQGGNLTQISNPTYRPVTSTGYSGSASNRSGANGSASNSTTARGGFGAKGSSAGHSGS